MPFDRGSFTFAMFDIPAELPENLLDLFAAKKAGPLDAVTDEPQLGWVTGHHLLDTTINEESAQMGGSYYLTLRQAVRKMPASLLNAICRRDELAYMHANQTFSVPRLEKKRIKEDAVKRNLMKMPPVISGTPVVVDRALNVMYIGTASFAQVDLIVSAFVSLLGVEPVPVTINELMIKLFKEESSALPDISFTNNVTGATDSTPGRDFLTWLWHFSELNGGELDVENCGRFQLGIEGPLTFGYSAEAKGAEESVVKKGCPQLSAEAKAALAVGKKLKKAKIMMARDQDVWTFTFDADKFNFTGLNLPEGEEMDRESYFAERVEYLHIFHKAVEAYFRKFVEDITGDTRAAVQEDIRKWAEDRESF